MHVYILSIHLLFTIHTLDAITTNYDFGVTDHESRVVDGKSPLMQCYRELALSIGIMRSMYTNNVQINTLSFQPSTIATITSSTNTPCVLVLEAAIVVVVN